jgi:hypothetical protein
MVVLSKEDLNSSIRASAHLVPGNRRVTSPPARWALGATVHMALSIFLAVVYSCVVKRGPLVFGSGLWLLNIKILAPPKFRQEDRSCALADHLCWAGIVHAVDRLKRP